MSKTLKQIRAGRLVTAVVYTTPTAGDPARARAQKQKTSTAAREKLNARTSFAKLERKLAANFDDGDLFITLTYDDERLPSTKKIAVNRLRAFIKELKKTREEKDEKTRYIYVTEGGCPGGRLHHHMVLNTTGEDFDEIRKLWKWGCDVEIRRLRFDQTHSYEDLATYLTKEPREWGHPQVGERTWTPSLGLEDPKPNTESVPDYLTLAAPPEAIIVANEGPVKNGYGEYAWIKYLMPRAPGRKRRRAKRKKHKAKG